MMMAPGVALAQDVRRRAQAGGAAGSRAPGIDQPDVHSEGRCNSCHNQKLAAAAQAFARERGIQTGTTIAQLNDELSDATTERFIEYAQGGGAGTSGLGYELFARMAAKQPADERVYAQLYFCDRCSVPTEAGEAAIDLLSPSTTSRRPR